MVGRPLSWIAWVCDSKPDGQWWCENWLFLFYSCLFTASQCEDAVGVREAGVWALGQSFSVFQGRLVGCIDGIVPFLGTWESL